MDHWIWTKSSGEPIVSDEVRGRRCQTASVSCPVFPTTTDFRADRRRFRQQKTPSLETAISAIQGSLKDRDRGAWSGQRRSIPRQRVAVGQQCRPRMIPSVLHLSQCWKRPIRAYLQKRFTNGLEDRFRVVPGQKPRTLIGKFSAHLKLTGIGGPLKLTDIGGPVRLRDLLA